MSLIVKIGADIRSFDREMKKLTSDLAGVTDKMRSQGEAMSTALTAPLAGLGVISATIAASFSDAQGQIQAQLGLTGKEAEKLSGTAQALWEKGFGESIGDVSNQIAKVVQNIKDIPEGEVEKVAEEAMTVAKVFGQDINDVTKTANQLMSTFGMTSTESFDMMTKGFQNGLDFSGEFLDTLNEYSPQFQALGFSGEQMFNTLAAGAEAGAFNLDKVGDAVKEFNIRAKDGSKTTSSAFQALGMDVDKMSQTFAEGGPKAQQAFSQVVKELSKIEDPVKRNKIGVELFGTQFEDLEDDVVAAMSTVDAEIAGVEGATKKAGDAVQQSMGEKFKGTFRELQSALVPLGEAILVVADTVLPKIADALKTVSDWFSKLSPDTQQFVVVLGLILAAVGPLLIAFSSLVKGIGLVKAAMVALKVASFGAFAIWILIAIAVAVLVAAIIIYWDEIVAFTIKAWSAIETFMVGLWEDIVSIAKTVWSGISSFFSDLWDGIKSVTETAWNGIKDFFAQWGLTIIAVLLGPIGLLALAIYKNWDSIKAGAVLVWNAIKGFLVGLWTSIVAAVSPIFSAIGSFLATIWNGISVAVMAVWNFIKQYLVALWTALMYFVMPVFNKIASFLSGIWNRIKSVVTSVWNAIKSVLTTVWNGIKAAAATVFNALKAFFTSVLNGWKRIFTTVWNAIKSVLTTVWNGIKSAASSSWNAIKTTIMTPINAVKTLALAGFNKLASGVKTIWNTVKSSTQSVWNGIKSTISGIVGGIASRVGSAFSGMKSTVVGVWNGIKSGIRTVINGIISMVNKFIGGFNAPAKALNKIPGVSAPTIGKIPMLATGGTIFGAGQAIVGEAGPELISKSGSSVKVTPLSAGEKARGIGGSIGSGSGVTIQVAQLVIREEADLTKVARELNKLQERTNRASGRLVL